MNDAAATNPANDPAAKARTDKWDPVAHPFRLVRYYQSSTPGLHGWDCTVIGVYGTLEEAADKAMERQPSGTTSVDVTEAQNPSDWRNRGRWKMMGARKIGKLASATGCLKGRTLKPTDPKEQRMMFKIEDTKSGEVVAGMGAVSADNAVFTTSKIAWEKQPAQLAVGESMHGHYNPRVGKREGYLAIRLS